MGARDEESGFSSGGRIVAATAILLVFYLFAFVPLLAFLEKVGLLNQTAKAILLPTLLPIFWIGEHFDPYGDFLQAVLDWIDR